MSIRFGIIGCSRVARRRFFPALVSSQCGTLVFVGSRDAEKAKEYADEFRAEQYGNYEDVLSSKTVDAVYISTPPTLHAEWVLKAARAGKHIICEKPAFPDAETARRAVEACHANSVRLFENYAFLYHPQHAVALSLIPRIGCVERIQAIFSYPLPTQGNIRLKPELGGGVLHDSFGYPLATALFYFGEKPTAVSYAQTFDAELGVDTAADMLLSFSRDRTLEGKVQMGSSEYSSVYRLQGPRGYIEVPRAFAVDANAPTEIILVVGGREEKHLIPPANQFQRALGEFCAAVRAKTPRDFEKDLLMRVEIREMALQRLTRK